MRRPRIARTKDMGHAATSNLDQSGAQGSATREATTAASVCTSNTRRASPMRNVELAALTILVAALSNLIGAPIASANDVKTEHDGIPVRGVVRAVDQAAFSTDLGTRVIKIGVREGEAFKAGDLLVEFDCRKPRAEAASAEAVHKEMKLTLDSNVHLEKYQAIGRHDVEISKARVAKAAAEADALKARLDQCQVKAPFDGRVSELGVHVHEIPGPGKPFLAVVGATRLEVELILPSSWLSWLKAGAEFAFAVDETKRSYPMTVARLGAAVDPVSQMIKVIAIMQPGTDDILPGMSGTAMFKAVNG